MKDVYLRFPVMNDKEEYIKYQKEEHDSNINYEGFLNHLMMTSNLVDNCF